MTKIKVPKPTEYWRVEPITMDQITNDRIKVAITRMIEQKLWYYSIKGFNFKRYFGKDTPHYVYVYSWASTEDEIGPPLIVKIEE